MGKIHKKGIWLSHGLSENAILHHLFIATSLPGKEKKSFLWRIVIGNEKWIYFDNPKRKKSWMDPGQLSASTPKRSIHGLALHLMGPGGCAILRILASK